jgi:hypothetical protein
MKKFFRVVFLLIAAGGLTFIVYKFFIEPRERYQSIYLVPENAAFIVESDKPFKAWESIIHSKAWGHLRTNTFLAKLDTSIRSVDSLINSKKLLLKMIGSRKVLVSAHSYHNKYDFLYVIDLKKISKLKNIKNHLSKIFGENFRLTQRDYKGVEIFELFDINSSEMYYFSLVKNQLIFSKVYLLLESSIDQTDKLTIGRDLNYIEVSKRVSGKGLFNLYIHYKYFDNYIEELLGKTNEFVSSVSSGLHYSGISFDIDEDALIKLTGFTSVNDTVSSYFMAILNSGKGTQRILEVTPQRTASFIRLGFDDMVTFYENIEYSLGKEIFKGYSDAVQSIEKRLDIDIKENFFKWIDNEIALVQTQPSNLGKNNEFAAIIKAKDIRNAKKNLDYILSRIKKKTPVKFKETSYKDYYIKYLHIPGFFKIILGKLLSKLEKPYYTIIDRYVIFSNHPQTLKSIIDDYESGHTLVNSVEFHDFSKNFSSKSCVFIYVQTPLFLTNLKEFVDVQTWSKIQKNKGYFTSFPHIGVQLDNVEELLKLNIATQYSEQVEDFTPAYFKLESVPVETPDTYNQVPEKTKLPGKPEIVIDDLDAGKYEDYYDNGQLKLSVGLKNGLKHGNFMEYYENGTVKTKGRYKEDQMHGTWSYFNEQGDLIAKKIFEMGKEIIK